MVMSCSEYFPLAQFLFFAKSKISLVGGQHCIQAWKGAEGVIQSFSLHSQVQKG